MAGSLRHTEWYLISEQKFRRRAAVLQTPQIFRGQGFLVLSDKITGQHLRLVQRAERLWRALDGRRTVQQIWDDLGGAASQSEVFEWIMTLVSSGMVLSDHQMDPKHLTDRGLRKRNQLLESKAAGPLSIKVSLFDPNRLIRFLYPALLPIFTPLGAAVIAALITAALITAALNWPVLAGSVDRNMLSQGGLIGLALAYPMLKAIHELAHGLLVHKYGGQVRDFGVMFLVFFPVPYVDASDANAFADKRARMLVAAGGVIAELTVAALSLFVWLYMEPGFERAVLFNFMVIGSVSTLLFNGNPLLKFDSYFVLADWLEIPNLASKAGAYVQDVFLSRVFGLRRDIHATQGEGPVLLIYGTVSLIYRLVLTVSITVIVSQLFFVFGLILAVWSLFMSFVLPIRAMIRKGRQMVRQQNRGPAAFWRLVVLALVIIGLVGVVKFPFTATGEGQVTVSPAAKVHIDSSGQIVQVLAHSGAMVQRGDPLLRINNPDQTARRQVLDIAVQELTQRLQSGGLSVVARQSALRELDLAQADLAKVTDLETASLLTAPQDGRLEWQNGRDPVQGGFVFRGDDLGQVIAPGQIELILAFPAAYAGLLPADGAMVQVLLPDGTALAAPLTRARVVDQGQQAPGAILTSGGGQVPEMPDHPGLAMTASLVVWLTPDQDIAAKAGMRVQGRIALPKATLWSQTMFHLRRLFLRAKRV